MEHHSYEERLRELELFSLEKRFWDDLTVALQNPAGSLQESWRGTFGKGLERQDNREWL